MAHFEVKIDTSKFESGLKRVLQAFMTAVVLKDMSEADKATVVNTSEEDLIQFHNSWGMGIRNGYNLWHDKALVKELGAEHPDDASMIIIKAVWKTLREPEELHNYFKERREPDMRDMSSYVNVDMDYDVYICEVLALHFGPDFNVETALMACEETGKIQINISESGHITTIKVSD